MEHRKVLRISTIVLAMAIFSLVIAKPGMAYAHSHFNPFDLPDVSSLHECGDHQLCGVAATGLKALDPTHGLLSGPLEKAGNDYQNWVLKHNGEDKIYKEEQEWQRSHNQESSSNEEDRSSDNSGGGSSHEDHGSSDNSGSSYHDHSGDSGGGGGGDDN